MFADQPPPKATAVHRQWYAVWQRRVNALNPCHGRGRLMVLMTHNTDISDTWEREGEEPQAYFNLFAPTGYAIGVNVVL